MRPLEDADYLKRRIASWRNFLESAIPEPEKIRFGRVRIVIGEMESLMKGELQIDYSEDT